MQLQTIQLNTYQAAYWEQGQGTALIFLHGFLGSSANWQRLIQQLAPHYRCIALDLLGFGNSAQPVLRYTIWHQIAFLQQFTAALNLQNFHLIGHSYGGWTATAYAIAAAGYIWTPDYSRWLPPSSPAVSRLAQPGAQAKSKTQSAAFSPPQSLTLIAPAGIRDDSFVGRYSYLRPLLWETPLVDWVLNAIAPLAAWLGQQAAFEQVYRARTELLKQPVAKSFLVDRLTPADAIDTVEKYLDVLTLPTQVIAAELDSTIPLWHCQTYVEGIANAQLTVLPDAEHDLIQTHCEAIARIIRQRI